MKTGTKANLFGALLFLALFLVGSPSLAEESNDPGMVVADLDVRNVSLVSQEKNDLKIAFEIINNKGTQGDIRYAVELSKSDQDGRKMIDRKVFDEAISLGEGEVVRREVGYAAPSDLAGEFDVLVRVKNGKGLSLGTGMIRKVILSGDGRSIAIDRESCLVAVSGEAKSRKLSEALSIDPNQKMTIQCSGKSAFEGSVSATARIKTYQYSVFGSPAGEGEGVAVDFAKGKGQTFKTELQGQSKAGGYEATLALFGQDGKQVSNALNFRFSVSGAGAMILNALSNKDSYASGETAELSLFWTKSGKISKLFAEASLVSGQARCAEPVKKEIGSGKQGGMETFALNVSSDCPGGKAVFVLTDESGRVLDGTEIGLKKASAAAPINQLEKTKQTFALPYILAVILLVIGIILIAIKKMKGGVPGALVLFLAATAIWGMAPGSAQALTRCSSDGKICSSTIPFRGLGGNDANGSCPGDWLFSWSEIDGYDNGIGGRVTGGNSRLDFNGTVNSSIYLGALDEYYEVKDPCFNMWGCGRSGPSLPGTYPTVYYNTVSYYYFDDGGNQISRTFNTNESYSLTLADCTPAVLPFCGDGKCDGPETCPICPSDCGTCPPTCAAPNCIVNGVCTPPGSNIYNCSIVAPVCDQSSCDSQVTGTVSCSYSNNCGTFSGTISGGMCGSVRCVPDTATCDCEKWREVAP